eukprot:m.675499 g.675499  ORF g.675499 m.675499 type:complete len:68 (-) comp58554_c0_seq4:742-945(-)
MDMPEVTDEIRHELSTHFEEWEDLASFRGRLSQDLDDDLSGILQHVVSTCISYEVLENFKLRAFCRE